MVVASGGPLGLKKKMEEVEVDVDALQPLQPRGCSHGRTMQRRGVRGLLRVARRGIRISELKNELSPRG